jgi:hypothetical protein
VASAVLAGVGAVAAGVMVVTPVQIVHHLGSVPYYCAAQVLAADKADWCHIELSDPNVPTFWVNYGSVSATEYSPYRALTDLEQYPRRLHDDG